MIHIGTLEDEDGYYKDLSDCLMRYGQEFSCAFHIDRYSDGITFLEADFTKYDIIFLDIQVPMLDGMQVAKKIREKDHRVVIIFVTSFTNYAIRGYEVEAMDYILKPVKYGSMRLRLRKAIERISHDRERQSVTLRLNRDNVRILISDIIYLEANRHKTLYHMEGTTYEVWSSFSEAQKSLPPSVFAQCHGSYVCNLAWVHSVGSDEVVLKNGEVLRLTRGYRKGFLDAFTAFWAD